LPEPAELVGLSISDPPERWGTLGFSVDEVGEAVVGGVTVRLGIAPPGRGIVAWTLSGDLGDLGLPLRDRGAWTPPAGEHPNGAVAVDHVVILTPDLDGFASALKGGFRRIAERNGGRQGFRRLGGPIMEVVEAPEAPATAFWGVTFTVTTAERLDHLAADCRFVGEPRDAVQPGRRIATVSREAGLSTRVAFMDPEPSSS
jgi:hypothetical protein